MMSLRIVLDSNVIISFAIPNTRYNRRFYYLISHSDLEFLMPREKWSEIILNYKDIKKRGNYSQQESLQYLANLMIIKRNINFYQKKDYSYFTDTASKLTDHKNDIAFIALALKEDVYIWTKNIKHFYRYDKTLTVKKLKNLLNKRYKDFPESFIIQKEPEDKFKQIFQIASRMPCNDLDIYFKKDKILLACRDDDI